MFARFKKRHEVIDPEVGKIIYPRGWAGELEKDTYAAAKEAGVLMPSLEPAANAVANSGGGAQKIAKAEKALVAAKEKLAAASEAEKAAAQVVVTEAEAALAALQA